MLSQRLRQACGLRQTDPARSFSEFRSLAEQGSVYAMIGLASNYMKGCGTPVDLGEAELWLRRAQAMADNAELQGQAAYFLGWCYLKQQNYSKALDALSSGSAVHFPPAIYRLARMHAQGMGVKKDLNAARLLYAQAAAQGHLLAKRDLALLLMSGRFGLALILKGMAMLLGAVKDFLKDAASGSKALDDGRLWP